MFATCETVGVAEWIIDDIVLFVLFCSILKSWDRRTTCVNNIVITTGLDSRLALWIKRGPLYLCVAVNCIKFLLAIARATIVIFFDPRGRPQSRPVVITIFTQSVRPSQNFKIKRQSLPAGTVGWPSGSLMTPVLLTVILNCSTKICG